ncbi:MAG TPA: hypothetical protein PLO50_13000 [Nitrospira sp.]|nr:hypothetical protein [Nitrospira sp.]
MAFFGMPSSPHMLANVEHWSFIPLSFTNHNFSTNKNLFDRLSHGSNSRTICGMFISSTNKRKTSSKKKRRLIRRTESSDFFFCFRCAVVSPGGFEMESEAKRNQEWREEIWNRQNKLFVEGLTLGTVDKYQKLDRFYGKTTIRIAPEFWAPRVWDGGEGATIEVVRWIGPKRAEYRIGLAMVAAIDYQERVIVLDKEIKKCRKGDIIKRFL